MHFSTTLQGNSVYLLYIGQLVELAVILDIFLFHGLANTTSTSIGWGAMKWKVISFKNLTLLNGLN